MYVKEIDFLIIGAAKCATTWLQQQLQTDPNVYMPDPELHFFSREYHRGIGWYENQFEVHNGITIIGEKSNSYLDDPNSARLVHSHLPNIKLIAQLRNPVERAYSDYCMLFRRGEVSGDIENYLDPAKGTGNRFLENGMYAEQLQAYIDLYGRDRLLILFFEGVSADPTVQLAKTRMHLGLPAPAPITANSGKVKDRSQPALSPTLRKRLRWLKPLAQPFRGNKVFETLRNQIAKQPLYPPLNASLRVKLSEHYQDSIRALESIADQSLDHWK